MVVESELVKRGRRRQAAPGAGLLAASLALALLVLGDEGGGEEQGEEGHGGTAVREEREKEWRGKRREQWCWRRPR